MAFYLPMLLEEIRLVNPDIIVTLGKPDVVYYLYVVPVVVVDFVFAFRFDFRGKYFWVV